MKLLFCNRSVGTTLSMWDTLDNATYPTAGAKYPESKTKVMCGIACPINLWIVKQYAATSG